MKATFNLAMYHEEGYSALWNMPVDGEPECGCEGCNARNVIKIFISIVIKFYQGEFFVYHILKL